MTSSSGYVPGDCDIRKLFIHARVVAALLLSMLSVAAQQTKPFPSHWGEPPKVQTRDFVEWPGDYGQGSGTVAKWIEANLAKDAQANADPTGTLYSEGFSRIATGTSPEDFMVLNGVFTVQEGVDGNKYLELPGAPIESFVVMFGPAGEGVLQAAVRIQAESRGRRHPAFALGLNGLGGYRLRVVPAKRVLELCRGPEESGEVVETTRFEWDSGRWTHLKLQVRPMGDNEWRVEGRAWTEGDPEPPEWTVAFVEKSKPLAGRPFVAASPYSGAPVRFDDFVVRAAK